MTVPSSSCVRHRRSSEAAAEEHVDGGEQLEVRHGGLSLVEVATRESVHTPQLEQLQQQQVENALGGLVLLLVPRDHRGHQTRQHLLLVRRLHLVALPRLERLHDVDDAVRQLPEQPRARANGGDDLEEGAEHGARHGERLVLEERQRRELAGAVDQRDLEQVEHGHEGAALHHLATLPLVELHVTLHSLLY